MVCLPVFFFLAGLVSKDVRYSLGEFLRHKSLRLLVPYLFFGGVGYLFWLTIGRHFGADAGSDVAWYEPLVGMLYGTSDRLTHYPPLWFLPCLMCIEWLDYGMRQLSSVFARVLTMVALFSIGLLLSYFGILLPWGIGAAMLMLPLYELGRVAQRSIDKWVDSPAWLLVGAAIDSLLLLLPVYLINPHLKISMANLGNPLVAYVGFLLTVVCFTSVAILLSRYSRPLPLLSYIGRNTLLYLLTHMYVFSVIKAVSVYLLHMNLDIYTTLPGSLLLCVITMVVDVLPIWLIRKYLPFLSR